MSAQPPRFRGALAADGQYVKVKLASSTWEPVGSIVLWDDHWLCVDLHPSTCTGDRRYWIPRDAILCVIETRGDHIPGRIA